MAYLNGNKVFTILGAGAGADGYPVEALHSENTILNTYGWKVYTGDTPLYKDDGMEVGSGVSTNLYFANYSKFLNVTDYPMSSYKAVVDGTTCTATRIVNTSSAVSLYFVNEKFILTIYKNKITARNTDSSAHTLTEFSNTNSGASYYYDLTVSGLTTAYRVDVNLPDSDREVAREASFFDRVEVSTGKMTFFAGTIPIQAVHIIYSAMKTNKTYHYGKVNGMDSDDKISASDLEQTTGTASDKVMSQGAVTYYLGQKLDSSNIVQTTGTATDKAMSQKSVTDELKTLTDQLANVNAIVHETVAQAVEEELTEVGTASIPSSITVGETAYPVIDGARTLLTEVKGKSATSKNLFNCYGFSASNIESPSSARVLTNSFGTTISTITAGNSVTVSQTAYSNAVISSYQNGYFSIGILGMEAGRKYALSFDIDIKNNPLSATSAAFFVNGVTSYNGALSNGKVVVKFTYSETNEKQHIEMRCGGMSFTASNFMLNEGTTALPYEPYFDGIKSTSFQGLKITDADENETNLQLFDTPQTFLGAVAEGDTFEITKNEYDEFYSLIKTTNIGSVDLGSINWSYGGTFFTTVGVQSTIKQSLNLLTKLYTPISIGMLNASTDKRISVNELGVIFIRDTEYENGTVFKTAMAGVMLYYQVAAPIIEVIKDNLTFEEVSAIAKQGGTISVIDNYGETYGVKPNLKMIFEVKHWQEV